MDTSTNPLILVADDEPTMLELVARHLKTMDNPKVEVIEASDGEQAWRLAREHLPDLVVLDVMMPGMSGWEVCRKIREDVALAHTGVVMLTGIGENLNQMTSPLYGADAYIDKPFEFVELDEKVKTALSARAAQREGMNRPATNGVVGAINVDAGSEDDVETTHVSPRPPKKAAAKPKAIAKAGKAGAPKKSANKAAKKSARKPAKKKAAAKPARKAAKKSARKPAKKAAKRVAKKKASSAARRPKKAAKRGK